MPDAHYEYYYRLRVIVKQKSAIKTRIPQRRALLVSRLKTERNEAIIVQTLK